MAPTASSGRPGHVPPHEMVARASAALAVGAVCSLFVHPELGWFGLPALVLGLYYLLSPVTEVAPARWAKAGATLAVLAVTTAGVHFTLYHAIPGILAGGRTAAAKSAVSMLRTIYWAQGQFKARVEIDADLDGEGEYGFIGELAGRVPLRDGRPLLSQPIFANPISGVEAGPHGGITYMGPYAYAVYLPAAEGAAVEAALGGVGPIKVDTDRAERGWIAYAWPRQGGRSATQAFCINYMEEILETRNDVQAYSGAAKMPAWDAALNSKDMLQPLTAGTGNDGAQWTRWKNKQAKASP